MNGDVNQDKVWKTMILWYYPGSRLQRVGAQENWGEGPEEPGRDLSLFSG